MNRYQQQWIDKGFTLREAEALSARGYTPSQAAKVLTWSDQQEIVKSYFEGSTK